MNKTKFYQIIVIGLIISNTVLLTFMFIGKKKHRRPLGPRNLIIERLDLDKEQILKFDALIEEHKSSIGKSQEKIRDLKNELYSQLSIEPQDTSLIDSLQAEIGTAKHLIEKTHYAHFLDIKNICSTEQLAAFELLSKDMARMFGPPGHRHRPNHGP